MEDILNRCLDIIHILYNKSVWVASVIGGAILTAIGYPKQVLLFVFTLVVVDIVTKQYSIVIVNYKKLTPYTYYSAWVNRHLTSRLLKNGIGVKGLLYLPILYIAHKASILPEVIFGQAVANVLYTLIMFIETSSILENFIECGHTSLMPFLKFIKNKQEELTNTDKK